MRLKGIQYIEIFKVKRIMNIEKYKKLKFHDTFWQNNLVTKVQVYIQRYKRIKYLFYYYKLNKNSCFFLFSFSMYT